MKKINCIALDDEPLALKVLAHYITEIPFLESRGFFTDPNEARDCLRSQSIDLLILDIQMPDISGLQFFSTLPKPPMVIFSTAFREFAVEGFELNAIDYIVKPYEFERFEKAAQKALEYHSFSQQAHSSTSSATQRECIFVKSSYSLVKIAIDDLILAETYDDYLKLHLASEDRPILTLMTLSSLEKRLPPDRFLRVHRSFLVALSQVESLRRNKLSIHGRQIPIGITYQSQIKTYFKE